MLIQEREDALRLVRQPDHALASGEMAARWRTPDGEGLGARLVVAVAMHDVAWRELDAHPRLDAERGRPFGFQDYPLAEKLDAYARGVERMAEVDPYVGLLGSLHFSSFPDEERASGFLRRQARRREELREALAVGQGLRDPAEELDRDLPLLKLFDTLSLYCCLAAPGSLEEARPGWVDRDGLAAAPDGTPLELGWRGAHRLTVRPFRFRAPFTIRLPVRDLPRRSWSEPEALRRDWEEARVRVWELRVEPGARGLLRRRGARRRSPGPGGRIRSAPSRPLAPYRAACRRPGGVAVDLHGVLEPDRVAARR